MGAHKRLKWKKAFNQYKYLSQEYKIIKSICREVAPEFQEHYEGLVAEKGHSLTDLNRDNKEKIKEAYGVEEEEAPGDLPVVENDSTHLVSCGSFVEKSEEAQMSEDEVALHILFSKLFKKIALEIHPDKIDVMKHDYNQRRQMTDNFKKANQALDNREYFTLMEIAEELGISLPKNYEQQTRWMKAQIKEIDLKIRREKSTYNYLFSEAETPAQKDNIIRQFVHQLFGLNL